MMNTKKQRIEMRTYTGNQPVQVPVFLRRVSGAAIIGTVRNSAAERLPNFPNSPNYRNLDRSPIVLGGEARDAGEMTASAELMILVVYVLAAAFVVAAAWRFLGL